MDLKNNARFEIVMSVAVIASIVIMALETFALPTGLKEALFVADAALSLAFVAEYLFRVVTAENKRAYITSFFGIIDLIAIFPILVHALASARVIRLLRVLRVIRLLKLKRYSDALDRYRRALRLIVAEATLFTGVAFVFIHQLSPSLIYEVEHDAQPDVYTAISLMPFGARSYH